MIVIVDSGSTKSDWVVLDATTKEKISESNTKGLNPAVFSESDLYKTITANKVVMGSADAIDHIYFYGAGCGTEKARKIICDLLEEIFPNANVVVREDIYAAAFAMSKQG